MQPRNGSSTPSPRRARFDEDEGNRSSAGIDQDLMREAFESQAALQREQAQQRLAPAAPKPPSNGSPFAPGYSLAGSTLDAERAQRSALASDVSPLDPSPAPARAGRASFAQDEEESDIGEDDEPAGWQSCKGRRSTSGHISTPFGAGAGPEEDEAPPAESLGGNAGFLSANAQGLQSNAGGGASRPTGQRPPALRLPQRPEPTAELPFFHRQQVPNASPRPPSGVFSPPQPGGPWQAPMSPNGGSTTPHIQRYDPFSSPSMVQPFSPRVTSSGSIKSPNLKPALVRRDQSVENFKLDDSGDSLERGAVRSTDAEDVRKTFGGTAGFGKALAGLYASATSANDGSDGRSGVKMPDLRRKDSAQSLGGSTLNGNDGRKGSNDWNEKQHDDEAQEVAAWARRPSLAWTQGEDDDELDEDDPRLTGKIRKSMQLKREKEFEHRRSSWSSESGDPNVPVRRRTAPANQGRRKSFASLREIAATAGKSMGNEGEDDDKPKNVFDRRKSTTTITYNVAHVMHRQKFILKLAKALMLFGAPSHRIESQLNATANVLEVDAQFIHFPGIVIASFGDVDKHTSETHFVKSKSDLALGPLHDVHIIYRKVVHDEIGVQEGTEALNKVLKAKACWSVWSRIAFAAARCFIMAPMSFGGSFADACIAACFGAGLTFLQLRTAKKNALYSNVFEISTAILISFVARGLSTTGIFCYQSIASSALILVLPGYVILCGSLELASKNMIAGSVRMVYAIIYSLFLGFGIAIGSDVYFLLDPAARKTMYVPLESSTMVEGSFTMANQTMPLWTGSFSFTNGTRNALNVGTINCERLPEWPWYRQPISPWFNFLFVPAFSLLSCFNLLQPLRSWDVLVMVTIACVGWTANMTANHFVFNRSDVVSAIGSFIIGILGNVYSRLFRGTAFTATAVAVLFLVPSGMAMAGGLAMTYKGSDGDLYSNGLSIGFRMIQVAIGITVGLFASGLVVYSLGRKKGGALFAF